MAFTRNLTGETAARRVPLYGFKPTPFSSHTLLLEEFPASGAGLRVLDIGCGDGYLARLLAERGFEVTGIERRGGYTSAFPAEVELVEADLEAGLPDLRRSYDFVLCADVLEHVRWPDQLLREVRQVLAPGGVLVASLPNSGNIWFRLNVLAGRFPRDDKGLFDRTHLHFFMWKGWSELFLEAGFAVRRVIPTAIPVSLVVPAGWQSSLPVRTAERICYGLARVWMKLFAYQFVVRAVPH